MCYEDFNRANYQLNIHILNKSGNHHFSDRVQLPGAKVAFDD